MARRNTLGKGHQGHSCEGRGSAGGSCVGMQGTGQASAARSGCQERGYRCLGFTVGMRRTNDVWSKCAAFRQGVVLLRKGI